MARGLAAKKCIICISAFKASLVGVQQTQKGMDRTTRVGWMYQSPCIKAGTD